MILSWLFGIILIWINGIETFAYLWLQLKIFLVVVLTIYHEYLGKCIRLLKSKENTKVGISLKPQSNIELIEKYLDKIDLVLIMSVEPGFAGQKFMPEVLEKTKNLILV